MRVIIVILAALLGAAMIKRRSRGGLLEWAILLAGIGCSASLVMEVIR